MPTIIDTPNITTSKLSALKTAGVKTIIRYINPIGQSGQKHIKYGEAKAIAAAGLRLGLVCEGWGGVNDKGIDRASGARDGNFCRDYAKLIGAPDGAVIYFAVDTDFSITDYRNKVIPYFEEINKAFLSSAYKIGIYGSGDVCKRLRLDSLVKYTWLSGSMGWTGSRTYRDSKAWNLLQTTLDTKLEGLDVDFNEASAAILDIGDFVPFGEAVDNVPVATAIPDATPLQIAKWLQMMLAKSGVYTADIDGKIGPKSLEAIKKELYS